MKKIVAIVAVMLCPVAQAKDGMIDAEADLQNVGLFRSDSDFDGTDPYYNPDGQHVGIIGTLFTPKLTFRVSDDVKIYYEAELGLNTWSKNNPDQIDATAGDIFLLKHREVYADWLLLDEKALEVKAGYQHYIDPTGLFINHWLGALSMNWSINYTNEVSLVAGQLPDTTYEGIDARRNNFSHDVFFGGLAYGRPLVEGDERTSSAGVYFLNDASLIGRPYTMFAPFVHLEANFGGVEYRADFISQLGRMEKGAVGEADQKHMSLAGQVHLTIPFDLLDVDVNLLALSPDDKYEGNELNTAFHYSGKNSSSTLLFTEDEIRDYFDNLDERMGKRWGAFVQNRAGLLLADAKLSYPFPFDFVSSLIVGAASVLEQRNALGRSFLGVEGDVDLAYQIEDQVDFHVVVGLLIPGKAAGALVNDIDLGAKRPVVYGETSLSVHF